MWPEDARGIVILTLAICAALGVMLWVRFG